MIKITINVIYIKSFTFYLEFIKINCVSLRPIKII